MSKKKLREKKKKARERDSKAKVLKRRAEMRAKAKYERQLEAEHEESRSKPQPYMKPETRRRLNEEHQQQAVEKDAEIKEKLEHNLEILKALEEEYLAEQEAKKQANEELEAEGHNTLQEKMDALAERAEEKMKEELADED
jgi:hypothetical protein